MEAVRAAISAAVGIHRMVTSDGHGVSASLIPPLIQLIASYLEPFVITKTCYKVSGKSSPAVDTGTRKQPPAVIWTFLAGGGGEYIIKDDFEGRQLWKLSVAVNINDTTETGTGFVRAHCVSALGADSHWLCGAVYRQVVVTRERVRCTFVDRRKTGLGWEIDILRGLI